jgi:hypothetical protein
VKAENNLLTVDKQRFRVFGLTIEYPSTMFKQQSEPKRAEISQPKKPEEPKQTPEVDKQIKNQEITQATPQKPQRKKKEKFKLRQI